MTGRRHRATAMAVVAIAMAAGWLTPAPAQQATQQATQPAGQQAGQPSEAAPEEQPAMVRLVQQAEMHLRAGDLTTALARYEQALEQGAGSAQVLNRVADIYLRQGNPARAVDLLRRSLEERPGQLAVYSGLNEAFLAMGQLDSSLHYTHAARQLAPDNAGVRVELAYLELQGGNLTAARAQIDSALQLDPQHAHAYRLLALYHTQTDEPDSAIARYKQVIDLDPEDVEAHNNIAFLLAARSDYLEALERYRKTKALANDPQLVHAINLNMDAIRAIMDGKMRARFILVGSESQARDLRRRVTEEDEDFGQLAARFSQAPNARDGGDLGFFGPGDMLPSVEENVLQLGVGEISDVIRIEQGWMLLQRLN